MQLFLSSRRTVVYAHTVTHNYAVKSDSLTRAAYRNVMHHELSGTPACPRKALKRAFQFQRHHPKRQQEFLASLLFPVDHFRGVTQMVHNKAIKARHAGWTRYARRCAQRYASMSSSSLIDFIAWLSTYTFPLSFFSRPTHSVR